MADSAERRLTVAVIVTVLNEGKAIGELLESLAAQTRQADEIIFVDGGSTDATPAIIQSYASRLPITLLTRPGANISEGRNAAVAAARAEIIASTDAGVRLSPDWLAALVEPFERAPAGAAPGVVAGFFLPDPRSPFETAMGATVLPRQREIAPARFLPSSRSVAFLRSAWERWPYPEWLDYCEDLVFDLGLRELGYRSEFRPAALARFRPRSNLGAFFRQYYRYARGDGKADLWRRRHAIRYATYLLGLPGLLALSMAVSPWWLLLLAAGVGLYISAPYRRLLPELGGLSWSGRLQAIALVPLIRLVGDVAKMIGYPVGLAWRWRHRADPAIHWRAQLVELRRRVD